MDIAHSQSIETMQNQEDIRFLEMQHEDPKSCSMGSADMNFHRKEMKKRKRLGNIKIQQEKAKNEQKSSEETVVLENTSSSSSESDTGDPTVQFSTFTSKEGTTKKRPKNVFSSEMSGTYDRLNISYRDSSLVYAITAKALGHDLDEISVSTSTLYRTQKSHRKETAESYQSEEFSPGHPLILHWDGKVLPDIEQGKKTVERIAVLVSGDGKEKFLGVSKVPKGTGEEIATVCLNLINEHGMEDRVRGLSFDTTASNTGIHIGACVNIKKGLGREVMYFACRHHIYEVVLSHVFKHSYGPSSGPEIPIFKRFKEHCDIIDKSNVQPYDFAHVEEDIKELREKSVLLVGRLVNVTQQRDDYKELLQLVLIFLGEATVVEFPLRAPGACHHARWMAKAIYCLKVILLKDQFSMSRYELKSLTDVSLFVSLVYIRGWSRASIPSKAAKVDMEFLRDADAFARSGYSCGHAAVDSMSRHLWYISETLIAMAFFDEEVTDKEKSKMVANLDNPPWKKSLKRPKGKNLGNSASKHLAEFVTGKTKEFFHAFILNTDFLEKPVGEWREEEGFKQAAASIAKFSVVNDPAERGIALTKKYNSSLTRNEDQKQYLLKTVVQNREKYLKKTKKEFMDK